MNGERRGREISPLLAIVCIPAPQLSRDTVEHYDRVQTSSGLHLKAVNMLNAVRLCLCFRFIIEMNGGQMFTNYRHDLLSWVQS